MTQRVQRREAGGMAGLGAERELESDSLVGFRDAVGIPLRVAKASAERDAPEPLGTLHVYKSNRLFTEREVRFCEVLAGCLAGTLHVLRVRRALEADNTRLRDHAAGSYDILIGDSPAMKQLRQQIAQFARLPCTVLITGESGVGKELVAAEPASAESCAAKARSSRSTAAPSPPRWPNRNCSATKKGAFQRRRGRTPGRFPAPIRARCFSMKSARCR